ncbi:hypothetical protein TRVA0_001S08196 [Trichomonascus vanleenenianus]|uniref:cyclin family protein n=1 Tax=Trichomonascus vanleenenianus TaxID=2268995 RepID=UPI003ECA8FF0
MTFIPESKTRPAIATPCTYKSGSALSFEQSKARFVEALVDSAVLIIQTIWPGGGTHSCRSKSMPLRKFIQETLKRSRTSYSTFQVSLYYLILIKPHVAKTEELQCGRRTFLSALILASKYLQDRNYSITAWSKISGLSAQELQRNEIDFLKTVDWNLHIRHEIYNRWSNLLLSYATEDGRIWISRIKSVDREVVSFIDEDDYSGAPMTPEPSDGEDDHSYSPKQTPRGIKRSLADEDVDDLPSKRREILNY